MTTTGATRLASAVLAKMTPVTLRTAVTMASRHATSVKGSAAR
nr:hypothetical protein [Mumia sp. zg.B21]